MELTGKKKSTVVHTERIACPVFYTLKLTYTCLERGRISPGPSQNRTKIKLFLAEVHILTSVHRVSPFTNVYPSQGFRFVAAGFRTEWT